MYINTYLVLAAELICKLIQALVHLQLTYIREDARGIVHTFKPRTYFCACDSFCWKLIDYVKPNLLFLPAQWSQIISECAFDFFLYTCDFPKFLSELQLKFKRRC